MRRTLVIAVALVAVAVAVLIGSLAASGGSSASSASEQEMQRKADLWEIDQLEKNFHKATTKKDIDLMMSLFAPNATFTVPGATAAGKRQIRQFWLTKGGVVQAVEPVDLRHAGVQGRASQSTATGARCTSSATTSTRRRARSERSRPPTETSRGSTDAG